MQKGTLAAVGVFAALLIAVLVTRDRGNVSVGMPSLHLPPIELATIAEIDASGPVSFALKKDGAGWSVSDPAKGDAAHPADDAQVKSLLDPLTDLKATSFVTDKADKQAEFELDAAKGLTLKVVGTSGPLFTIIVGKPSKTAGSYVRNEQSPQIFVLPGPLGRIVHRDAKVWRKHAFVPVQAADLAKLTVTQADGSALNLESADGKWALSAGTATPPDFRFDAAAAGRLAGALAGLSATDFGDGLTDATAGFAEPHLQLKAQKKDGTAVTVHLGHLTGPLPDGGVPPPMSAVPVRVDGDPQVYLVSAPQAGQLGKRLDDLRDTSLVDFDPAKAVALTLHSSAHSVTATKAGGAWTITDPKPLPAGFEFDPGQVSLVLSSIKATRATQVALGVTPAAAGLTKPTLSIDVALEDGTHQRLQFGGDVAATPPGQVYVQGSVDKLVYSMPNTAKARFDRGVDAFKKIARPPMGGGGMQGLDSLPPEIRKQIEEQMRKQQH